MPVINQVDILVEPGPCNWFIDTTCVADWDTYTVDQQVRATTLATFVLDAFTGHQFAQCAITVRPCSPGCGSPGYRTWPVGAATAPWMPGSWMTPYISSGTWRNCMCGGGCSCLPDCRTELPAPVAAITEVKVDGLVLDPSAYAMVGEFLVRTDGGECWPSCQDPAVPDTEEGTFSVTFQPGRVLPAAGQIAAGMLAGEFARACAGNGCALPAGLSTLTRQGVQVEMLDPTEVLAAGRTGIRETDLFIEAVNPAGLKQRSRVYSPDMPRTRTVYG